ncbi:hypothetical protein AGMMS50225_04750 [Betaproteobacteria bacterium]|nr:hypothetical protein AGMMS50225_04750 [Betaproteobacteria bacterium]
MQKLISTERCCACYVSPTRKGFSNNCIDTSNRMASSLCRMGCTRCTFTAQTAKAQTLRGLQESTPARDPHHARIFPRRGFSPQRLRRQEHPKQQQRQEPETDIEGF